jgi:hypothetical protein
MGWMGEESLLRFVELTDWHEMYIREKRKGKMM